MNENKPGLGRAMKEPGPVILIILAVMAVVGLHNPEGLALCGILIGGAIAAAGIIRNSPGFVARYRKSEQKRQQVEEKWKRTHEIEKLDAESRIQVKTIIRCFDDINQEIQDMDLNGISPEYTDMLLQSDILVTRSVEMAQRRSKLLSYLLKVDPDAIMAKTADLQSRINADSSDELRKALESSQEELQNTDHIKKVADQILEYLENTASSFTNLRSKLVLLKSTDAQARLTAARELGENIGNLSISADSLNENLSSIPGLVE